MDLLSITIQLHRMEVAAIGTYTGAGAGFDNRDIGRHQSDFRPSSQRRYSAPVLGEKPSVNRLLEMVAPKHWWSHDH
jgi:hypothetical protein